MKSDSLKRFWFLLHEVVSHLDQWILRSGLVKTVHQTRLGALPRKLQLRYTPELTFFLSTPSKIHCRCRYRYKSVSAFSLATRPLSTKD